MLCQCNMTTSKDEFCMYYNVGRHKMRTYIRNVFIFSDHLDEISV